MAVGGKKINVLQRHGSHAKGLNAVDAQLDAATM